MAVSVLPNGCVVGERTFGGTGPLYGDYKFAYSGAWENSAVSVYGSTAVMKDARGKIHEGVGIVPHIEVLQTPEVEAEMRSGVDPQLERALEYIRTGKCPRRPHAVTGEVPYGASPAVCGRGMPRPLPPFRAGMRRMRREAFGGASCRGTGGGPKIFAYGGRLRNLYYLCRIGKSE